MVQLTIEQRTFLVKNFFEAGSLKVTRKRFAKRFPERLPLALKTIWEREFSAHDTTLNRNKGIQEDNAREDQKPISRQEEGQMT